MLRESLVNGSPVLRPNNALVDEIERSATTCAECRAVLAWVTATGTLEDVNFEHIERCGLRFCTSIPGKSWRGTS